MRLMFIAYLLVAFGSGCDVDDRSVSGIESDNAYVLYLFVRPGQSFLIDSQRYSSKEACEYAQKILEDEYLSIREDAEGNLIRPRAGFSNARSVCMPVAGGP